MQERSYIAPSKQLGDRPYRAIIDDIEKFHSICGALGISEDSRITLADVEQRRAGMRIGLCLWHVADALRERGFTRAVPDFAPADDHAKLRRSMPREANRTRVEQFSSATTSPVKLPSSSAAPSAAAITAALTKAPAPALAPTSAGNGGLRDAPGTPTNRHAPPSDPVSLQRWLHSENAQSGARAAPASGLEEAIGSPPIMLPPSAAARPAYETPVDDQDDTAAALDDATGDMDVLQSILSPERHKPAHAQMLNALLRADMDGGQRTSHGIPATGGADDAERMVGGESHTKRSLKLAIPRAGEWQGSVPSSRGASARLVKMMPQPARLEGRPWWGIPLGVGMAAAGIVVAAAMGRRRLGMSSQRRDVGASVRHQGRW